jgi:hypothetical protein
MQQTILVKHKLALEFVLELSYVPGPVVGF